MRFLAGMFAAGRNKGKDGSEEVREGPVDSEQERWMRWDGMLLSSAMSGCAGDSKAAGGCIAEVMTGEAQGKRGKGKDTNSGTQAAPAGRMHSKSIVSELLVGNWNDPLGYVS